MLPLQIQNTVRSSENMIHQVRTIGMTNFLKGVEAGKQDPMNVIKVPFKDKPFAASYTYPQFLGDVKSFFQKQKESVPPENCKKKGGSQTRKRRTTRTKITRKKQKQRKQNHKIRK